MHTVEFRPTPRLLVLATTLLLFIVAAQADPPRRDVAWRASFTNLATRLLESELGVVYGGIQVYPTNEYTPPVHRILQVSANVHKAARPDEPDPNRLPSVFQPRFVKVGEIIFISGYEEVTGDVRTRLLPPRDLANPADREALQPDDNVFGIPWIIAAQKGLPNFNELAVDNLFEISRALQIRKPAANLSPHETNQLFIVSASSAVGLEAWNSYREALTRPVTIIATNRLSVSLRLANTPSGLGSTHTFQFVQGRVTTIPAWEGTGMNTMPASASFFAPIVTNTVLVTNRIFRAHGDFEQLLTPSFDPEDRNSFPIPDITLTFTNYLQFAILDQVTGGLLDYVQLETGGETNLSSFLADPLKSGGYQGYQGLWTTNRLGGDQDDLHAPPFGVVNQIDVALGRYGPPGNLWRDYGFNQASGTTADKEMDWFRAFMTGQRISYPPYTLNTNLVERVPFTPAKRLRYSKSWQANDPLLHATSEQLESLLMGYDLQSLLLSAPVQTLKSIGRLNDRYEPWGGNPNSAAQSSSSANRAYDLRFKDPLVRRSDDWNFPSNDLFTPLSLGRIHRGTPWQTLYCKADELPTWRNDLRDWTAWTGIRHYGQMVQTRPQTDWNLVAHLVRHLWPVNPHRLLSVNESSRHQWFRALHGTTALTNTNPDEVWQSYDPAIQAQFETQIIAFKSEQAGIIVDGMEADRAREHSGYFEEVGDILAVEELSTSSPFLNLSATQRRYGITDEAYEAIALQLLPKLRPDSIGRWVMKNGKPHLRFSGLEDCLYRIECSTDLIHWQPLRIERAAQGCLEFEVAPNCGEACRYYRSVLIGQNPPPGP